MCGFISVYFFALVVVSALRVCPVSIPAQLDQPPRSAPSRPPVDGDRRTAGTSPCIQSEDSENRKQRENEAIANLPTAARFWLTEDVVDLVSPEERCAFLQLATDEERTLFIEQFWARRAPDPSSLDNSFKRTHYDRIVFANEKYGTKAPGFMTDRGRIYVTFGPPDLIESHRAGEKNDRAAEDGVETYPYSWESWHYGRLEGIGENVEVGFVDREGIGDYRLAISPEAKDAQIITPINLNWVRRDASTLESAKSSASPVSLGLPPVVRFKDLEAIVVARIIREQVTFSRQIEFAKTTNATTVARISIHLKAENTNSQSNSSDSPGKFNVFARISKPNGWVAETVERTFSPPVGQRAEELQPDCQFNVAIAPGPYLLTIAIKNADTGETGVSHVTIEVPSYEQLTAKK